MKDEVINLIITACELQDEDYLNVAMGIVQSEENRFADQIETLSRKVFEASKEDKPLEGLLDVISKLLGEDESTTKKVVRVSNEEQNLEDYESNVETKTIRVDQRKRGKNLFDPKEYEHLYHDEDHQEKKAKSKPTPKPSYEKTLVEVKCSVCGDKIKIPQSLYAGKGTGTKCEDCLVG